MLPLKKWILVGITFLSQFSVAEELFEYQRPISAMGMGGVFVPFIKDTDAVIWNPAALGFTKEITWEIMNVGAGANASSDLATAFSQMSQSGSFASLYGQNFWLGYQGKTSFAAPRLGFAGFNFGYVGGALHTPSYPTFDMTLINDYGFTAGTAFMLSNYTSVGIAVKRINRWGGPQSLGLSLISGGDSTAILNQFQNRGYAYGFDLAMMAQGESGPWKTSAALVWQDVGMTSFVKEAGTAPPPMIHDNMTAALGAAMDLPGFDFKGGLEYRHMLLSGEQFGKKVHLGVEFGLPMFDVRAGLNQGYTTYGIGTSILFMDLDIASYTEEVGIYPGQTGDQRIEFGLSMSLGVDADFKFTAKDGKRRKLKQRR